MHRSHRSGTPGDGARVGSGQRLVELLPGLAHGLAEERIGVVLPLVEQVLELAQTLGADSCAANRSDISAKTFT